MHGEGWAASTGPTLRNADWRARAHSFFPLAHPLGSYPSMATTKANSSHLVSASSKLGQVCRSHMLSATRFPALRALLRLRWTREDALETGRRSSRDNPKLQEPRAHEMKVSSKGLDVQVWRHSQVLGRGVQRANLVLLCSKWNPDHQGNPEVRGRGLQGMMRPI